MLTILLGKSSTKGQSKQINIGSSIPVQSSERRQVILLTGLSLGYKTDPLITSCVDTLHISASTAQSSSSLTKGVLGKISWAPLFQTRVIQGRQISVSHLYTVWKIYSRPRHVQVSVRITCLVLQDDLLVNSAQPEIPRGRTRYFA